MQHGEPISSYSVHDLSDMDGSEADMHKEIGDINLAYMLLARKLVKQDRAAAMLRLGISAEMADLLDSMVLSQLVKLASSNLLLCSFRIENHPLLKLVAKGQSGGPSSAQLG